MRMGLLLALLLLASCRSVPEHHARLWPAGVGGEPRLGLATEDGVVLLAEPGWKPGDAFDIQLPVGNSLVSGSGVIDRINDTVAVVRPLTARLTEGRFAESLPAPEEVLYLALRDAEDEVVLEEARLWCAGSYGDFLVADEGASVLARDWPGAGVYVHRDDRWQIVGLLSGLVASLPDDPNEGTAVGFVGLSELARILPEHIAYFDKGLMPQRPDFEYGVPLQPGDVPSPEEILEGVTAPAPAAPAAPAPAPAPADRGPR